MTAEPLPTSPVPNAPDRKERSAIPAAPDTARQHVRAAPAAASLAELASEKGAPPDALPLARVEAELCTLAGQLAAATCRFLMLLADFDARRGWAGWNIRSCAHWLSWKCGVDLRTAQEQVRVARALTTLPTVRAAFAAGRISYSKVRAIARVATPDSEADLVMAAEHAPAAQLERLVRSLRTVQHLNPDTDTPGPNPLAGQGGDGVRSAESPAADTGPRVGVQWRWDVDGTLKIWGRLPAADGAALLAAAARATTLGDADPQQDKDSGTDSGAHDQGSAGETGKQRGKKGEERQKDCSSRAPTLCRPPADLAPALTTMADLVRANVPAPVHAPAAEVVVVVDAATLAGALVQQEAAGPDTNAAEKGATPAQAPAARREPPRGAELRPGRIDDGPALSSAVLARLACAGRIRLQVRDSDAGRSGDGCALTTDGRTLDLGRATRWPTAAQKAALWRRDRGCAVPGCERSRFLHVHHVRPWGLGGRTSMDNLILLCGEHHRALHNGAFRVIALGKQRFRFTGPDGEVCQPAPAMAGNSRDLTEAIGTLAQPIGPGTIQPNWNGAPLELDWATVSYLAAWQQQQRRRARETKC